MKTSIETGDMMVSQHSSMRKFLLGAKQYIDDITVYFNIFCSQYNTIQLIMNINILCTMHGKCIAPFKAI